MGCRAALKRVFEKCTNASIDFSPFGPIVNCSLFAAEKAAANEAGVAVSNEIARIEARCSRYRADSELSRIDAAGKAGASVEVDDETAAIRPPFHLTGSF